MIRGPLVQAVREMLERHWDVYTIASRLKIDINLVAEIVQQLSDNIT